MDLISEDAVGTFGLLAAEAVERLVDRHDTFLDKRAAMLNVGVPSLAQEGEALLFTFKVSGTRQKTVKTTIGIEGSFEQGRSGVLGLDLACEPGCTCPAFSRDGHCVHTLAASWWLQEQLGRRSIGEMVDFFSELQVDEVSEGHQLVDDLLRMAEQADRSATPQETRLQWRLSLANSRYYSPITIRPYEQRPRKNGKGWTKGREIRGFDLLRRDFSEHPTDGRIAPLVASPSYSFEGEHYPEFNAVRLLVGHPNVAWDDGDAAALEVHAAELTLRLVAVDGGVGSGPDSGPDSGDLIGPEEGSEVAGANVRYRPQLAVSGIDIAPRDCSVLLGYANPIEPLVVLADHKRSRLVVCSLRDPKATQIVQHLLRQDFSDVLLDREAAGRLAVQASSVDGLVRVELPDSLAGPIEGVDAELVIELRPRPGEGLSIRLAVFDERFRELPRPGGEPQTMRCLTESGPVRLRRDLAAERERADGVIARFGLSGLTPEGNDEWVAESDAVALDLLSRLYDGGEETPRMVWPEGETLRVRGEITPASLRVQIDDRRDWFGLQGAVSVDGREVKLAELLEAVRENRTLVRIGDREFAKISDEFRRRLERLGDTALNDRGSLKVADAAVPAVQELLGEDIPLEATRRWHTAIERLESLAEWTPVQPSGLDAELRDYQLEGYRWLARLSRWGVGGVLADDMGLGKTVQALGVLVDRAGDGPALVVAPTSVGDNWVRESERFTPQLRPHLYRDSDRDELIRSAGPGDLVIVSYQLLQRDAEAFARRSWNTLLLDEAQFVKNSQTKTSQAIRGLDADWRLGLSGTPLENHLGELWSLFRTLSPGLLGSWDRFRKRFAEPIERHHDHDRRKSLAQLVQPFILRRTKDKVLRELPSRTEVTLRAEFSPEERRRYEEARFAAVADLSGLGTDGGNEGDRRIRTLAWLTRLRQLACHPALVDKGWKKSSAKLDLLMSLIEELREGDHRALIFSQFVKHLTVVRKRLDKLGIPFQYLDGATPSKERQRRVDAFQNGEGDLFLISLKAGGTGLNLTAADYVIHLDPWWNPAVEDQATDRAHRIGQDRAVTVYRLVAEGTIEEQILEMHANKRELVAGVLDGTDRAGRMKTDELIQMIKEGVPG